jgi:sugar O-acyltransferase (sialic acid O-acetyltransferase NeuD family)
MARKHVVIVGAGGHGREVAEILCSRKDQDFAVLGFVDEATHLQKTSINGLPVLGDWSWFDTVAHDTVAVICAVGLPEVRKQLVQRATEIGLSFCNAISPSATISPAAKIGQGVMVFPQVSVGPNCFVGDHTIINVGSTVSHDTRLEHYVTLNPGVHLAGNVSIGEGCNVGIGAGVIHQVSIGAWSIIGAGASVVDDLPQNVTAVGLPARAISTREKGWHERVTGVTRQ